MHINCSVSPLVIFFSQFILGPGKPPAGSIAFIVLIYFLYFWAIEKKVVEESQYHCLFNYCSKQVCNWSICSDFLIKDFFRRICQIQIFVLLRLGHADKIIWFEWLIRFQNWILWCKCKGGLKKYNFWAFYTKKWFIIIVFIHLLHTNLLCYTGASAVTLIY